MYIIKIVTGRFHDENSNPPSQHLRGRRAPNEWTLRPFSEMLDHLRRSRSQAREADPFPRGSMGATITTLKIWVFRAFGVFNVKWFMSTKLMNFTCTYYCMPWLSAVRVRWLARCFHLHRTLVFVFPNCVLRDGFFVDWSC